MKLQIYTIPNTSKTWRVTITVVDMEDFPTRKIFQHRYDFPTNGNYCLFPGNINYIMNSFPTKNEALQWATRQADQLRSLMTEWRNPPQNEIRTIYL